jgi:hypothetical protein
MQSLLSDTGRVLPLPIRIPPPSIPDGAYTDEIRAIEEQRAGADAAEGADADVPAGTVSPDVGSVPAPQAIREDDREGDFLAPVSWWCKDEERPNLDGESEPAWRCRHGDYEDADRRGEVDGDRSEWGDGHSWDRHGQSWDPDRWDRGDRGFEQDAGDDRQRDREEPDDFDHNGYESSWRDRH